MNDQEKEELEKALVMKARVFFQLLESGMLSGKYGNIEARRRKEEIRDIGKQLDLTKKEQIALINKRSLEAGT